MPRIISWILYLICYIYFMNINNCNKKDFMEDLTDAMAKLGDGGTRDADDII